MSKRKQVELLVSLCAYKVVQIFFWQTIFHLSFVSSHATSLMWNIHSAKAAMPWMSCPCFSIGGSVASLLQRNSWNVNASLQQICRRLVNSAIKGRNADGGLALNTEVLKKWTVGILLLGEFGARVFFWIVWFGFFEVFFVKIWVLLWCSFPIAMYHKHEGLKRSSCFEMKWFSVAMHY